MPTQARSLAGKVVAITGAARGIGRATAEALVRENAKVAIGDLDATLAQRTAEEIGARPFALDVVDKSSFEGFVEAVERERPNRANAIDRPKAGCYGDWLSIVPFPTLLSDPGEELRGSERGKRAV